MQFIAREINGFYHLIGLNKFVVKFYLRPALKILSCVSQLFFMIQIGLIIALDRKKSSFFVQNVAI